MNQTTNPLDDLARQAEQTEAEAVPAMQGLEEAPPAITNAQAIAGAIGAGREAFCFFTKFESPRRVLNDDRVQQLAALADPVFTKYGINVGAMIGDFGPELALAAGLFAVVLELRQAVSLEAAEKAKKAEPIAPAEFTSSGDGQ